MWLSFYFCTELLNRLAFISFQAKAETTLVITITPNPAHPRVIIISIAANA